MSEKPYYQDQQFETSGREPRSARKKGGGVVEYLVILLVSFLLCFHRRLTLHNFHIQVCIVLLILIGLSYVPYRCYM